MWSALKIEIFVSYTTSFCSTMIINQSSTTAGLDLEGVRMEPEQVLLFLRRVASNLRLVIQELLVIFSADATHRILSPNHTKLLSYFDGVVRP